MFDGITGNEKGPNAALGEITTNVVNADGGHLLDSDGDGVVDSSTGLLVGDLNLDGIMNNGETGFFVSLADATTVLKSTNHELGGGQCELAARRQRAERVARLLAGRHAVVADAERRGR